jgi:uncharacterized protein (DUF433 family)
LGAKIKKYIFALLITLIIIMNAFNNIITINPEKRFGKPCVRETRITVYDVLGWLSAGMSYEEILFDFPELTKSDILACLAFAAKREHTLQYA